MNLRIVGPTPLPPSVREALARPMIYHRGPQWEAIQAEITDNLKHFFQTQSDVFIYTASGTGGMEAAVANTISPGDEVLSISIGNFGERFATIARTYGAEVTMLEYPWGQAADPDGVRRALADGGPFHAVTVTHNETSTGVTNPLADICRVVREHSDAVLLVDSISALGALDLPVDAWGCDVAITGSQKSWMIPPGLAMLSVSQRAWAAHDRCTSPRFYWSFAAMRKRAAKNQTPYTPAVGLFVALQEALRLMRAEGRENVIARHRRIGQYTREGVKRLGLSLFADEAHASNTVTAIRVPEGISPKELRRVMEAEHEVIIAGGQRHLADQIVRVGHLGMVDEADIDDALQAMEKSLKKLGFEK